MTKFIDVTSKDHPFKMNIDFRNYGREVAGNARFYFESTYIRAGGVPWYEWANLPTWKADIFKPENMCSGISNDGGIPIYPSLDSGIVFEIEPKPQDNIPEETRPFLNDEVKGKKTIIVIYGCVIYETTGKIHHRPICGFLEPENGKEIREWELQTCLTGANDYEVKN